MVRKLFLTPASIPEEETCRGLVIPNSQAWLGVFSEALSQTIYPYNYEQINDTDLTPEDAATEAYERYTAWLAATCEGGECPAPTVETPDGARPIYRKNPTTDNWETLQTDGTWLEPSGAEEIPDPTARGEETPTDRICAAATNVANRVKAIYDGTLAQINEDVDASELAVFVAGEAAFWAGAWVYPPALATIAIDFAAFLGFAEFGQQLVLSNLWNDHFTYRYICCLKSNAVDTGGVVTFDRQAVNECLLQAIWTDQQYVLLVAMVIYIQQVIGEQGLNLLGTHTAVAGNCSHCGEWARDFDFRLGQNGWGTTTAGDAGTWSTNGYWQAIVGGNSTLILTCNPPIDTGFVITRVVMEYDILTATFEEAKYGSHSPTRTGFVTGAIGTWVQDSGYTLNWNGAGDVTVRFFRSGATGANIHLKRYRVYGTGTMPFSAVQGQQWNGA